MHAVIDYSGRSEEYESRSTPLPQRSSPLVWRVDTYIDAFEACLMFAARYSLHGPLAP